jgi:hypothetical protein
MRRRPLSVTIARGSIVVEVMAAKDIDVIPAPTRAKTITADTKHCKAEWVG